MAMHFGPVRLPPARLPIMPDLLLVDIEAAAGLSGRRDAEGCLPGVTISSHGLAARARELTYRLANRRHEAAVTARLRPAITAMR